MEIKILKARINWNINFANDPVIEILIDRIPDLDSFVYEQKGQLYYAESMGISSFFSYIGPGQGYGGRVFSIKMKDGSIKKLYGPFSSNSTSINYAGFGPCINVLYTDNKENFTDKFPFLYSGNITIDLMNKYINIVYSGRGFNYNGKYINMSDSKSILIKQGYKYCPAVLLNNGEVFIKNKHNIKYIDKNCSDSQLTILNI